MIEMMGGIMIDTVDFVECTLGCSPSPVTAGTEG